MDHTNTAIKASMVHLPLHPQLHKKSLCTSENMYLLPSMSAKKLHEKTSVEASLWELFWYGTPSP